MHILFIGAAGMIGRKLVARLLADGALGGRDLEADFARRRAAGGAAREPFEIVDARRRSRGAGRGGALVAGRPDVIFHLAAIVSGEAETDFDKGYASISTARARLFDAIRAPARATGRGRVHVARSRCSARRSPKRSATISSRRRSRPTARRRRWANCCSRTIRGAVSSTASASGCRRSACGRASRTRRRRASSPASSASRSPDRRRCCRSPTTCGTGSPARARRSDFLVHAAGLERERLGPRINLTMPGVSVTVGEQIEALAPHRGTEGRRPHPPRARRLGRAHRLRLAAEVRRAAGAALGFRAEASFDEIVRAHIEDELGGKIAA